MTLAGTGRGAISPSERVIRIKPSGRWAPFNLRELWVYRELLYFLTWRDVKVRYKQTLLGAAWALVQPLVSMVIFATIFGQFIRGEYGVPYPLFVLAGLLPWQYFSSCLTQSSNSIVGSSALVTKVYFPRLLIPLASIVVPLIDFALAFCVLGGLFAYYGETPHWHAVVLPVFLGMALLIAFGVGLWLSALNVRYRDVPYAVPFLVQVWFYATPVLYGVSSMPERLQWALSLNPMTGVIDGFRWAVLGTGVPQYHVYAISTLVGLAILLGGLVYFKHVERRFADVI